MFVKLFKPRWQHSKATVRIKAVHRLSPGNTKHLEVLTQLARQDQSVEVRLAAVDKIAAPDLLSDILIHDSDPDIRRTVTQRICNIILDPGYTLSQQSECLISLQDENILTHIALNSTNSELQQQALQRITDQHCLISLTINGNSTHIRQSAANKLSMPELLEQASKAIKGRDKTVYRIIRNKQQQLLEQSRHEEILRLRQEELLSSLEHLSQTSFFPLYNTKLIALCQQWDQLQASPEESIRQRYEQIIKRCQHTVTIEQQRSDALLQNEQQERAKKQQQAELLQKLEEITIRCETLISGEHFCTADLDAEQNCWDSTTQELLNKTNESTNIAKLAPLKQRFTLCQNASRNWIKNSSSISTLLNESPSVEAAAPLQQYLNKMDLFIQQINWPTKITKPVQLQAIIQQCDLVRGQLHQLNLERLHCSEDLSGLLNKFEQQIEAGQIKAAGQIERQIETKLDSINGSTPKSLQQRYKGLTARLSELKNWQGFAVEEKKELLCQQMEALIDNASEPPALAKKIHQLQQQWKQLDGSDPFHSRTIWQRFKAASDQAYTPCESYFRGQKQQREDNLRKRTQLVSELSDYLNQLDWQEADWGLIEQLSRTVKREWKDYAPVDRTPGRQVQTKFNALLKQLDGKISGHRDQVANDKKDILNQAIKLAAIDNIESAATQVKALQKRWKEAGNTFHSVERELWPEFRKACNLVFDNLNKEKQVQSKTQQSCPTETLFEEALLQRIRVCDQLENLIQNGTLDQLALDEVQSVWAQSDRTNEHFEPLINRRYELLLEFISGRIEIEQLLEVTEIALRKLCIRLEILLGQESPEQDQSLRMEYQMDRLQKALELRDKSVNANDLKNLELEWQCHPFTLQHEALQIRFYSNLQQVK
ncbi:DUF349 domain-containing protein [Amphritea japonica]|uniref:DUF349 domain-containing protein n=1 Tax=Amphritea japonica ATCC BAA-1530 TaxID=1278309 RepID=A0A7R6PJI9_9GAMM|nr:DUF349 domain-containing protein [Amphritea japonica]BBB25535.1 conserved hypothetical protein [Amphritea japonica ATCC BAA-1530]